MMKKTATDILCESSEENSDDNAIKPNEFSRHTLERVKNLDNLKLEKFNLFLMIYMQIEQAIHMKATPNTHDNTPDNRSYDMNHKYLCEFFET